MTNVFVCGDPGENASILPLHNSVTPLLHSWCDGMGCHCLQYTVPLVLIRGTLTAQRYVHDILQRLTGTIFQQENARPHTARVSQDCLRTVTTLVWPARSQICLQSSISEIIWDGESRIPRV
ncbi:transposable element Tcb2 transposase [Trichonephila clavipes]|nr:transposable element Tcb2 transposase [Trichonephila clavipes]